MRHLKSILFVYILYIVTLVSDYKCGYSIITTFCLGRTSLKRLLGHFSLSGFYSEFIFPI